MTKEKFQKVYLITTIIPFLMLVFPFYGLANRATPIVMGVPFSFFWVVMWIVITFIAISILYFKDPENNGKEE
jgi:hypothetical protein